MVIKVLCSGEEIREAIRDILSFQRHPTEVRIVSPVVTDPEVWEQTALLQFITRLSRVDSILIVLLTTKPHTRKTDAVAVKQVEERKKVLSKLEGMGVRINYLRSVHAKLILAESRRDKLLLISSANLTTGGLWRNTEAGIVVKNEATELYDKLYEYISILLGKSPTPPGNESNE